MRKFDANYFDKDFFEGKGKGAIRHKDSPHYRLWAQRVDDCITNLFLKGNEPFPTLAIQHMKHKFSILDVGGGVGWEAKHLFDYGYNSYVVDVSQWAKENSVVRCFPDETISRHRCYDARDIDKIYPPKMFDLVISNRMLAYLPDTSAARKAMKAMVRLSKEYILFAIICSDHKGEMVRQWAKNSGRLNFQPKIYWMDMMESLGLKIDFKLTEKMREGGWDCIWWCSKGIKGEYLSIDNRDGF